MIIHMYSAGMDEDGRVVIGRPGDTIEVPIGHRSCGAPIGYPCTCENCMAGSEAGAGRGRRNSGSYTSRHEAEQTEQTEYTERLEFAHYTEQAEHQEESGARR